MGRLLHFAVAPILATTLTLLPISQANAERIRDRQWHLEYLKVAEAHRVSQGEGITVAVIDSGVEPHPDLRANLLPGADLTNTTANNSRGNGQQDTDGHGTQIAGLIAANSLAGGALGVAPRAKILPVRIDLSDNPASPTLGDAVRFAIANKAQVINLSVTGDSSLTAIQEALDAGVVVVAGAGNTTQGYYGVAFPAAYPGVVAVGGTDKNGNHGSYSVTGKELTIAAPGADIVSTSLGGKYSTTTGTSDSTAIVSGAVALIRSKYPNLSAKEVVHRLTATATDKGAPGRDPEYGYGELNLLAALTADVPPLEPSPTAAVSAAPTVSPTSTAPFAAPRPRNDNTVATVVVVTVATLLAVGLLVFLLVSRLRRRN